MNAIVSGRSGRALIIDGETLRSVEINDPSNLVSRKRSDLPYLFGDSRDLHFVENATTESVVSLLTAECDFTLALDLTLISLDDELEADIRREALEGLEELFVDSKILERVEHVMYSHPVPDDGDLDGALEICTNELKFVSGFLSGLQARQPSITEVDQAWEAIPTKNFDGHENRKVFRRTAVQEGLFHALATTESPASLVSFQLKAGLNPSIKRLPNYRQVIQAWVSPFRQSRETPTILREEEKDTFYEVEKFSRRGAKLNRRAVLQEVQKKKSIIVSAMHHRDLARVSDLIDDLVAFHLTYSESQHTAKSLCDLAMEAKALDMSSLQLALTERSINIAPGDQWSWIQHADALLIVDRLSEALEASGRAIAFGGGAVAKSGRAEVLKAQGQFDAALAAYEEVISQHPEDVIARNGRAEVLKAQGQFDAALAAYEEVISQHPEDVVAKNGRAEVLKAQGQFDAALAAFDEVMNQHPENVVAKNGRAEVLKAQGQFDAALAAFDEVMNQHPENVVAKSGRAEVLKAQGQFDAALAAYEEVISGHPENVVAKSGRAEVIKAQGHLDAALADFEEIISQHPENVVAKNGRAEVLKAQGQFDAALAAYEEIISQHPENVVAKNGRAEVLKAQGQFDAALAAYEEVINQRPEDAIAKNGRAEVLKAQGRFDAALAAYEEVFSQHPENIVAKTGCAEILKARGQFDAALAVYDEVISRHPENVVAKSGRAEVLKTQGKFDAALAAYEEIISRHPESVVPKNGRAEVLKAQGQFDAALAAYEEVISRHPESVVAKTGRAEVLKARGRFDAALAAYEEVVIQFPQNTIARTGRSCVLVVLHRYEEALDSLPAVEPTSLDGWIPYHIRGMTLLRLGRLSEAINVFDVGLRNAPTPSQKEYFRGALGLSWLRRREFKKAGEALEAVTSPVLQPSADVIRIHVFGAQGNSRRAIQAYENLATTPYLFNDELTQELHHRYVLGQEPTKDDEWVFDREVGIFLRAA